MNARIEHQDWISVIATTAAADPGRTAFTFSGQEGTAPDVLTYGRLDQRAKAVAAVLRRRGFAGQPVLLLQPPGLEYVVSFVACLYAGAVAVPVYPPTRRPSSVARLASIVADCGAVLALTTAAVRDRLLPGAPDGHLMETLQLLASDQVPDEQAHNWRRPPVGADTTAFLQYTSGSTATPRGVLLTHGNLLHNSSLIQRAFRTTEESRGMSWLPLFHDMGLIGGMLQPLYYAGSCALMSPAAFSQDPMRWLREISRTGATVSGGPDFAYELCADLATPQALSGLDLSRWAVAFNGAEPIRARTMERFGAAFGPAGFRPEAFTPCYGLAEATLIVSCKPHGTRPVRAADDISPREAVSSGRPDGSQRVEIVDPVTRRRVEAGAEGEIWLSGPSVAQGYWNRPEQNELVFRARLTDGGPTDQAFLRTGDLGMLRGGELFVTGRLKDLIVVRGRNHYPQDIERTVEAVHPGLRANCGAAVQVPLHGEEQVVVIHEVARDHQDGDLTALARDVRAAVTHEHGIRPLAVVLIRAATLSRTSSGKVQRHACATAYRDGGLSVLAVDGRLPGRAAVADAVADAEADPAALRAADRAARPGLVLAALRSLLADQLDSDPSALAAGMRLPALGLDSMGVVRLRHDLHSRLGVLLELEEALSLDLAGIAELLAARLESPVPPAELPAEPAAARDAAPADHPLARNQAALWFLNRMIPDSPAHLISTAFDVCGALDTAALGAALDQISARHPALRSTFPLVGGEPVHRVHAVLPPSLEHLDAQGWEEAELAARIAAAAEDPFDLDTGPLLRVRVFSRGADEHRLVFTVHHLVADLWSLSLLLRELDVLYPAARCGRTPELADPVPYPVFTRRQAQRLASGEGQSRMEQWAERLADGPFDLTLPTDRPRRAVARLRGAAIACQVGQHTTDGLTALARREGTTLYSVLLAAYQVLLARCTGQPDVVVGSPVHGRDDTDLVTTVGFLVNTVPLRTVIDTRESFTALLHRVHATTLSAFGGGDVPFASLVERLRPARDPGARPLVRTVLALQQAPGEQTGALVALAVNQEGIAFTVGGLDCVTRSLPTTSSQFDLQLTLGQVAGGLAGSLRYDTDLYDTATAQLFADRLGTLLTAIVEDASRPVGELPVLSEAERRLLLEECDAPRLPYDEHAGVVRQFEAVVAADPDAVAVVAAGTGGEPLSYGELDRLANAVAHRLRASGIGPGDIVAVLLPRTPRLLVGLLGVLKSGAAYLPLDAALPAERLAFVLGDAGARAVLTDDPIAHSRVLRLDGAVAERPPAVRVHPSSPAYVIYTSGSTGVPKGVVVPHRALTNLIASFGRDLPLTAADGWLSITTPSFDIAALEYFLPLVRGATVHLADEETAVDGARLRACLADPQVTYMQATPVTWRLLLDSGWSGTPGLTAICGGERMPAELTRQLPARGVRLWNAYGPTETTIWSLRTSIEQAFDDVPLGGPVANTKVQILDDALRPVPVGAIGELFIGGDGLAQGYLRRPGATAERFLPDPFAKTPGARLYRTGDLARRRTDGRITFVGRTDTQVKVHGHRIELGEIEAALERHRSVRRAAVLVDGDSAQARLVAYVEAAPGTTSDGLREALLRWLPSYCVPHVFVVLDALPLTPNAKVDRRALPRPGAAPTASPRTGYTATPTERRIAAIVAELLPAGPIGREDDLFTLGAHSLMMSRLVERIRAEFSAAPPLVRLFENPTVAGISALVDQEPTAGAARPALRRVDRSRYVATTTGTRQ